MVTHTHTQREAKTDTHTHTYAQTHMHTFWLIISKYLQKQFESQINLLLKLTNTRTTLAKQQQQQ